MSGNKTSVGAQYLADGRYDGDFYVYIGKSSVPLDELPHGSVVVCGNKTYAIRQAQMYKIGEKDVYCWAMLRLSGRSGDNA